MNENYGNSSRDLNFPYKNKIDLLANQKFTGNNRELNKDIHGSRTSRIDLFRLPLLSCDRKKIVCQMVHF